MPKITDIERKGTNSEKMWADLLVVDIKNEKAYIFGFDGELTLKIPDELFWQAVELAEKGET